MRVRVTNNSRPIQWAVWGGLGLIVLIILAAYVKNTQTRQTMPNYGVLPDFSLTNQDGQRVTLGDLRGQVWIADAIFTRCPGQCLLMSSHMKQIQDAVASGPPVRLVSFTTDPAFDSPAVLKKYAQRFEARDQCWSFLTGSKSALHAVEVDGLKLPVLDKPAGQQESANDLFIHSEKFVLLDKQGRIRGYFDGQEDGTVAAITAAAQALARE